MIEFIKGNSFPKENFRQILIENDFSKPYRNGDIQLIATTKKITKKHIEKREVYYHEEGDCIIVDNYYTSKYEKRQLILAHVIGLAIIVLLSSWVSQNTYLNNFITNVIDTTYVSPLSSSAF